MPGADRGFNLAQLLLDMASDNVDGGALFCAVGLMLVILLVLATRSR